MIGATVRAGYPLRLPSSGSTRTGTRCAAIPLFKNSATKNSREPAQVFAELISRGVLPGRFKSIWRFRRSPAVCCGSLNALD